MFPDISERCRAKKRIHDRMDQHIRIGMSQKTLLIGNLHAAHDQLPAFHQLMYIVSCSYPHCNPLILRYLITTAYNYIIPQTKRPHKKVPVRKCDRHLYKFNCVSIASAYGC